MTFLIAASSTREATPPHKETTYPPHRNHRGKPRLPGAARPHSAFRNHPAPLDSQTLDARLSGDTARAALPGLSGLAAGRRVVAGVGNRSSMRTQVTP